MINSTPVMLEPPEPMGPPPLRRQPHPQRTISNNQAVDSYVMVPFYLFD